MGVISVGRDLCCMCDVWSTFFIHPWPPKLLSSVTYQPCSNPGSFSFFEARPDLLQVKLSRERFRGLYINKVAELSQWILKTKPKAVRTYRNHLLRSIMPLSRISIIGQHDQFLRSSLGLMSEIDGYGF